jgi:hypothetical protein
MDVNFEEEFASGKSLEPTLGENNDKKEASKVELRLVISRVVQHPSGE